MSCLILPPRSGQVSVQKIMTLIPKLRLVDTGSHPSSVLNGVTVNNGFILDLPAADNAEATDQLVQLHATPHNPPCWPNVLLEAQQL